ncbi:MAG: putative nucleotidyltransferase with HDIG domain [Polyangiales bacterium]|jgi:putative nucleotidyltransferase with HDIG domain
MTAVPVPIVSASLEARANSVREDLWFGDDDPTRSEEAAAGSLSAATARSVGVKPFPAVAAKAMELSQDPDVTIAVLAECIESDPIMAARLLKLANSALYRPSRPYASIEQAVARLGLDSVVELVVGIATMQLMADPSGFGESIRKHSAGVAAISRVLATEMRFAGVGRTFLASLLHDIGKLLIFQADEFHYEQLPEAAQEADQVHIYERVQLGYDHAVLAAHVMHEWKFPPLLCRAVAWHHQSVRAFEEGGEIAKIVSLMRVADTIVHAIEKDADIESTCAHVVATPSGARLPFSTEVLTAMWPRMQEARDEMLAILG